MKYFSASRKETFQNCMLRGYHSYICYWKPQNKNNYAADFGNCIHAALDGVATAENKEDAFERGMKRFEEKWCELEMPIGEEFDRLQDDLRAHTPKVARAILALYIAKYFTQMKSLELLSVEQEFQLPLMEINGETIFYRGKIDKIYKGDFCVRGIDHKTTSAYRSPNGFRDDFLSSFYPNDQIISYSWILGMLYGNMGENEMIIDAILVWENARGPLTAFTQIPLQHTLEEIEMWKISAKAVITQIVKNTEVLQENFKAGNLLPELVLEQFPRNTAHCIGKYGRCPFYQFCAYNSKPLLPMDEIPQGYTFDQKRFEEDQKGEKTV